MEDRYGYPKVIQSIGDEFRAHRMDRGLSRKDVAKMFNVTSGFIYKLESSENDLSIKALHISYTFLGRLPLHLNIDETTLQGKLFLYRVRTGDTLRGVAKKIGIDVNALIRLNKGRKMSDRMLVKIEGYIESK